MRLENSGWEAEDGQGFALAKTIAERQFFRKIISLGAAQGAIVSTVLKRGGDPVAIGFSLRGQDMLFGFKTAFDRQHAKFSPGIRIFHETTRKMLGSGDYSRVWPAVLESHYARGFSIARRLALLLTFPRFLPATGPLAMRSSALMKLAVRVMGNFVTDEDDDMIARV